MSALDPGRCWPRALCSAFGITASSVDATGCDPGRHALAAELLGQLCAFLQRPDLPDPIV
jgi:hypothetical protein